MVIDYKLFKEVIGTQKKLDKLLFVIEQVPSHMISHDVSQHLYEKSFFGSFNRAFFQKTKNDLDQALINHLYGGMFDYKGAARGKIFHQLQNKVKDLKSLKSILRYNGFNNDNPQFRDDPSKKNPGSGISARYDLARVFSNLSGGIDCKLTNFKFAMDMVAIAISGPTNEDNRNLKTFDWKDYDSLKILHDGVPQRFDFPWIYTSPNHLCCNNNDIYRWEKKLKK